VIVTTAPASLRGWWNGLRTQQVVNWTAVIAWAGIIFYLSSMSEFRLRPKTDLIPNLAHFAEYAVLTFLLIRALRIHGLTIRRAAGIAAFTGLLYAGSDEFHQSFVRNRTPSAADLLVDALGIATIAVVAVAREHATSSQPASPGGHDRHR
jgi:VanZ family protein